jgi:hypothetical protein
MKKQNNLPAVNFSGSPMLFDYTGEPASIFVAGLDTLQSQPSSGGHTWVCGYINSPTAQGGAYYFRPSHQAGNASFVRGNASAASSSTLTLNKFVVESGRINLDTDRNAELSINGANKVISANALSNPSTTIDTVYDANNKLIFGTLLGSGWWKPSVPGTSAPSDDVTGYISQVLIYDQPLSDEGMDAVNRYLMRKYGMQ